MIVINASTFAGTKIAGFGGAVAATLGYILPSCRPVPLIVWVYLKHHSIVFGAGNPVSPSTFRVTEGVIFAGALALFR